jgi:hypothetical protein
MPRAKRSTDDAAYAIVRVDPPWGGEEVPWENRIKVTKIVFDLSVAHAEADRLNRLNGDKGALYFWQTTHVETFYPVGDPNASKKSEAPV